MTEKESSAQQGDRKRVQSPRRPSQSGTRRRRTQQSAGYAAQGSTTQKPQRKSALPSRGGRQKTSNHREMTRDGRRVVGVRGGRGRGGASAPKYERRGARPAARRPQKKNMVIPPIIDDRVRIIPLGGVEQIGKNMTVIETKNDIFIVDIGFQFREQSTPGIDYILPNTKYLEEKKDKIRAVFITHGHLDHIGGIPYVMGQIGNPPIYSRNLTTLMIKKRQEEFPHLPPLDIKIVEKDDRIAIGKTHIRFFAVTHTIPDSMGVIIETAYGDVVCTGDLKLDHVDGVPTEAEEKEFAKFKDRKVLMLMADSTNVERPGFSLPESVVFENIKKIINETKGRLIVATFASLIERLVKIIEFAEESNKKVVVDGRSMKTNIEVARLAGIFKPKKGTIIPIEEMGNYPPDRIIVLATGAQGDEFASLMRAANKTHKYIKINPRDTILLSSSIIPGNERGVQTLKDNLSRQGAKIVHYRISDVHSSGHANYDETAWIHRHINPRFFMPMHGYHYMLRVHKEIAKSLGMPGENIVIPDNGMIIEIGEKGKKIAVLKEKAPSNIVMVDGFAIGDIQEVVIRDRQMLAQDGIFVIIAIVDTKTGKVMKSPDIMSRGFVYLRESQDLLQQARYITKKTIEDIAQNMKPINFDHLKAQVTDNVGKFLLQQTAKRPMVLPVLIGV
ncbi:MAG: ribonuclease J [Patescibacteria group bacterium]|nr:MAG: ribonuclease J [Patescibacteria group bacterium]